MEPPKPHEHEAILQAAPQATPADLEEYERLLSARYRKDPSAAHAGHAPAAAPAPDPNAARLQELSKKLVGTS